MEKGICIWEIWWIQKEKTVMILQEHQNSMSPKLNSITLFMSEALKIMKIAEQN